MSEPDPCALFLSALHEDKDRITNLVHEKIMESPAIAINRIPDGGMTNFNDNLDRIEYRGAKQAYKQYQNLNDDPKALVPGDMNGVSCTGETTAFATSVNEQDPNACHDSCLLDFGQGYKIYRTQLFRLAVTTPVVCAFDYIRMGKAHVDGYFRGFTENFTDYGMDNFEANLLNYVIQYGEANASCNSLNELVLTTGGFNAPPTYRLNVPMLRRYRQYMIREQGLTDTGLLDVETTRQDALDAVQKDLEVRAITGQSVNIVPFEDLRGKYYEKEGIVYDGIRFIFNELPVRGYFKPAGLDGNGAQVYTFVRVYHWINEPNEDGGLSWQPNHDYDKLYTICEGIKYPMCSLAFVINPKSFTRYGLGKPMRFHGDNAGANYEMLVIDKSYIDCNDYNDKFRLAARHMFRFGSNKPELSGAIAYVHDIPADYAFLPGEGPVETPDLAPSLPQVFEDCDQEGCCPSAGTDVGLLVLSPCGPVTSVWDGEDVVLTLSVDRTGDGVGAASGTIAWSGSAGNKTVSWADGETGPKEATFLVAKADAGAVTATLAVATGTATLPDCIVANVTVVDATA